MTQTRYLIALGSNIRHPQFGAPRGVIKAAFTALREFGEVITGPIIASRPIGPSLRQYANSAAIVTCDLAPLAMLAALQQIERDFGRMKRGQKWRARVLDLDIILWSGGDFNTPILSIPHNEMTKRAFVLGPAAAIAPHWRAEKSHLSLKHHYGRLTKAHPTTR